MKNWLKKYDDIKWKAHFKRYGLLVLIGFVGIVIGRTTTEVDTIKQILVNTISGIMINLPWFILIYIGVSILSKSIKEAGGELVKHVPEWLTRYEKIKTHHRIIEKAMSH